MGKFRVVDVNTSLLEKDDSERDGIIHCQWKKSLIGIGKCIELQTIDLNTKSKKCDGCKYFNTKEDLLIEIAKKKKGNELSHQLNNDQANELWCKMQEEMLTW